jgi:hypothetical protein
MDVVVLGVIAIVFTVISVAIVGVLFVWAARKDGEENDAVAARAAAPTRFPPRAGRRRRRGREE